jgi:hypothetical protein
MTQPVDDSQQSKARRWMIRNGLAVGAGFALLISSFLGGALFTKVMEFAEPGMSLMAQKLVYTVGGRGWATILAVLFLMCSQWLRGRLLHFRQREYDYTGRRALADLRADPNARVPDFYLYLRAFETTGKLHVPLYLRLRRKFIWVGQRLVTDDLESYASLAVGSVAPLIALGKPGEAIGAGRIVTDDASWQADIITLMRRAKGILLVPSERPGTVWEMDTLKREGLLSKVVFIMPPLTKGEYDTRARWNTAKQAMATHGLEAPEHQDRGMLFRLDLDGKLVNVEPLLLSSPRKIRKSLKRIFKTKRGSGIYKAIVKADKRAGGAAFWGWLENGRQLSVFPVALLAVFMATPNTGFDPRETWATVFDRSMTSRELSESDEAQVLAASPKYQMIKASVAQENISQLNQVLLARGLPRIKDEELRAYYAAQGEMLARVSDDTCAAIATGNLQPAMVNIALTYIPSERVHDYLDARKAAILAGAEDAPAPAIDQRAFAEASQQLTATLNETDRERYQRLNNGEQTATANDRCWQLRAAWRGVEALQEPYATVWARELAVISAGEFPPARQPEVNPEPPDRGESSPEPHAEPQKAAILHREPPAQPESGSYEAASNLSATASIAPTVPDPNLVMLEKARSALNAGRLVEPRSDCALYWVTQLKQNSSPLGADVEQNVLDAMQKRIYGARLTGNYDSAIDDVNKLMQFYPGRTELISLKSQILSQQQTQAAEARLKKFTLQHRHVVFANNGSMVQAYCVGVLILAPDGNARFDCINTFDPQGRCDHVVFPRGTIKDVKFLKNGLLHVATNHTGNFDFYGESLDLQGAYQALVAAR